MPVFFFNSRLKLEIGKKKLLRLDPKTKKIRKHDGFRETAAVSIIINSRNFFFVF